MAKGRQTRSDNRKLSQRSKEARKTDGNQASSVDRENENSNHCTDTSKKRWNGEKCNFVAKKTKSSTEEAVDKGKEVGACSASGAVQFEEDDQLIQMDVDADDFSSEGEVEESDSENADQQMEVSMNHSLISTAEMDSEAEATEAESETENEEIPEHEAGRQRVGRSKETKKRVSVEDKLDTLTSTLQVMQDMMIKKGFFEDEKTRKSEKKKGEKPKIIDKPNKKKVNEMGTTSATVTSSETTIYEKAVKQVSEEFDEIRVDPEIHFRQKKSKKDRISSSSDEPVDTSDEFMDVDVPFKEDDFIAECAVANEHRGHGGFPWQSRSRNHEQNGRRSRSGRSPTSRWLDKGEEMVWQAEAARAKIFAVPGKELNLHQDGMIGRFINESNLKMQQQQNSVICDENYMMMGTHLDSQTQSKIVNHEYVDFAKLIPKDRIAKEDDHRLEIANRGGSTFFIPVSDRDTTRIHNFSRWEQAFRVFSNVYTKAYPARATELIQYNHLIYTASLSFIWDNVYLYDREFHMHLSNFPQRSWSVICNKHGRLVWKIELEEEIVLVTVTIVRDPPGKRRPVKDLTKASAL